MSFSIPKYVPPAHRSEARQGTVDPRRDARVEDSGGVSPIEGSAAPSPTTAAALQKSLAHVYGDKIVRSVLQAFDIDLKDPRELTPNEIKQLGDAAATSRTAISGLNQGSRLLLSFDKSAQAVGIDPAALPAGTRDKINAEFDRLLDAKSESGRRAVDLPDAELLMQQAIRNNVR